MSKPNRGMLLPEFKAWGDDPSVIKIEVSGEWAQFSRPEYGAERMTYDVITPSAARSLLDAVYWHPGMGYVVDRIHVLRPIVTTTMRRNEGKTKPSIKGFVDLAARRELGMQVPRDSAPHIDADDTKKHTQRQCMYLRDVRYVIEGHIVLRPDAMIPGHDSLIKFGSIVRTRLHKGETYRSPYLGTRECLCAVKPYLLPNDPIGYYTDVAEYDCGMMLYDLVYPKDGSPAIPGWYHCVMHHGVIDLTSLTPGKDVVYPMLRS